MQQDGDGSVKELNERYEDEIGFQKHFVTALLRVVKTIVVAGRLLL